MPLKHSSYIKVCYGRGENSIGPPHTLPSADLRNSLAEEKTSVQETERHGEQGSQQRKSRELGDLDLRPRCCLSLALFRVIEPSRRQVCWSQVGTVKVTLDVPGAALRVYWTRGCEAALWMWGGVIVLRADDQMLSFPEEETDWD